MGVQGRHDAEGSQLPQMVLSLRYNGRVMLPPALRCVLLAILFSASPWLGASRAAQAIEWIQLPRTLDPASGDPIEGVSLDIDCCAANEDLTQLVARADYGSQPISVALYRATVPEPGPFDASIAALEAPAALRSARRPLRS